VARLAALFLVVFGLFPLANWIPGGHEAPWYGDRLEMWFSGGAIVLGSTLVAWIVLRHRPSLWPEGRWTKIAARWQRQGYAADLTVAFVALISYLLVAQFVFSARPLLIDEIIQLWQARVFAAGSLWLPTADYPEFTAALHLVDLGPRTFGQFPAGGPALLAIGELFGAAWIVGPVVGALAVFMFSRLLRAVAVAPGMALAALMIFAFAPFTMFLSGSMMNHMPLTACVIGAALATVLATRDATPRPFLAFLAGLALGVAATFRPLDAVAFALPTAIWFGIRVIGDRRQFGALLASGLGVLIPVACLLAVNAAWTGDPLRFGYIELWGKSHELGFHESPWGPPHTPWRGIELVNLYLLRLQTYFLETPVPALLFATVALGLTRIVRPIERWMIAGSSLLLVAYFAYWHDGFYLGPRFMLPLAPWLAWWTAALPSRIRELGVEVRTSRAVLFGGVVALLLGAFQLAPIRATQYHNGMLSMRHDAGQAAVDAGITDALILARETWGAQLIVRLWASGVSRTEAEQVYRSADSCALDELLGGFERGALDTAGLREGIGILRADSASLVPQRLSPDTTLRALPGRQLREVCQRRLIEDQAGTTLFAPLILAGGGNNVFVRDLHARDSLLSSELRARPQYLLTKVVGPGGALVFTPIDPDSQRVAWDRDAQ
jgi:hypothetical protein